MKIGYIIQLKSDQKLIENKALDLIINKLNLEPLIEAETKVNGITKTGSELGWEDWKYVDIKDDSWKSADKKGGPDQKEDETNLISQAWESAYKFVENLGDNAMFIENLDVDFDIDHLDEDNEDHDKENILESEDFPWENGSTFRKDWPKPEPNEFAWYLDHSQLRKAYLSVDGDKSIRIAHIDSGYANHICLPKNLRKKEGKNFKEKNIRAIDPISYREKILGLKLRPKGHGTKTMVILAGKDYELPNGTKLPIGGNPDAVIIPLRINNSPINFNKKRMIRAINHASNIDCEIVSLCMGTLPNNAMKRAVNKLYTSGRIFVAAAGNHFPEKMKLLSRIGVNSPKVVAPSRFDQVITVCGITYDYEPYMKEKNYVPKTNKIMSGNWGPSKVMKNTISAFSPNVPSTIPSKEGSTPERVFTREGGGTSSATPQVSAAVSLYLSKYREELNDLIEESGKEWMRTEIVRTALCKSAGKTVPESPNPNRNRPANLDTNRIGSGYLQAEELLKPQYSPKNIVNDYEIKVSSPEPERSFPNVFRNRRRKKNNLLTPEPTLIDKMYEIELEQLFYLDSSFEKFSENHSKDISDWTDNEVNELLEQIKNSDFASPSLKKEALND